MISHLLAIHVLSYAASRLSTASAAVTSQPSRSVSVLFENDADWEHFGDHASALLFHEPATVAEARTVCKENNETLFDIRHLSEISNYLSYLQFSGEVDDSELFWAASNGDARVIGPVSQLNSSVTNASDVSDSNDKHPFLCTNSAPHTTMVDTDFSSSPKTDIASKGTVFTGTRDHLTFRFMGIPYAQAPTGALRFKHAQPPKNAARVDATALKPGCLQFGSFQNNDQGLNPWGISEDCLFLNVFTPHIPSGSRTDKSPNLKPVLLWIHGGANINGLGSDATFDGGPLVSRTDTVVVTINYRLNIFGFLALNDGVVTGNYALSDKIAALQWVKENIAAFGGDPEKVTIFGQSAGGWSVIDLVKSPKAKGLFHAAISQSGGSSTFSTAAQAGNSSAPVIARFCNGTGTKRLECLQALPSETLLNITNVLPSWPSVQDGVFVIDSAVNQVSEGAGAINSVPFLVGFMPDEGQSLLSTVISPNDTDFNQTLTKAVGAGVAQKVLASGLWEITDTFTPYNATVNVDGNLGLTCPAEQMITAAAKSSAFPALFVYVMRHGYGLLFFNPFNLCTFPVGHPEVPSYLCHSAELYEIFGTYHIFQRPVRVEKDIHYTALVQDMWGAFAKTGNPNPDKADLRARGPAYASTLRALESGFVWPQFSGSGEQELVASLDYPGLAVDDSMPDEKNGRCALLLG
ncbi:alpha/beta-hydrolase [Marasmius fiardii PR-910]|nr:alpha/beta-hydrolase [Marasmius fiardii PR-910]